MDEIVGRNGDHIRLATAGAALTAAGPGFDDVALVHVALPEVDFEAL